MSGVLDGIRVVDLSTVVLGPWAAQTLGDMGATVIKVETPTGDISRQMGVGRSPGMSAQYLMLNRNKRSVKLDLTRQDDRDALVRIIATADVLVHNMRPKIAAKLGIDRDELRRKFPRLIYCETYGFHADGPLANKPAYDDIIQAACGLSDLVSIGTGQPRYVPTIVADKTTAYNVAMAICAALYRRERDGLGEAIQVPMFETLVENVMIEHLAGAAFDPPIAEMGYSRILTSERRPFPTKDGFLAALPYTDENWRAFLRIAGREELLQDPRMNGHTNRVANSSWVYGLLAEIIATRTTQEWLDVLDPANIPAMRVNKLKDLLNDEQLAASGMWSMADHPSEGRVRTTNPPVRFSRCPSSIRTLAPRLGEHTEEVLLECGLTRQEVDALRLEDA